MTLIFYAQPYDISAEGFYFHSAEDYAEKVKTVRNQFGQPIEEFEIQFIDGGALNTDLAQAWELNQINFGAFIKAANDWDEVDKIRLILAVGQCGYSFDPENVNPAAFEVDIYGDDSIRDLAIRFVDDGLFGEIPDHLSSYIDYDTIARDLHHDGYCEAIIAGERLIYRCS